MLQTCEIRWFFSEPPVDLDRILSEHTEVQERTDWYIVPANAECGVKLREGSLEMKLRCASYGERNFCDLIGYLEIWKKWSLVFGDEEAAPSLEELAGTGWLDVDKKRYLQRFHVDGERVWVASERPLNGCEFEVTELMVEGHPHWTVGFEAVGELIKLESNLATVCQHIATRQAFRQPFTRDNSYGYAQWLAQR